MGKWKMISNLEIDTDYGFGNAKYITEIEYINSVRLNPAYVKFILQHNGAMLETDTFDFYNPNRSIHDSDYFCFVKIESIQDTINTLLTVGSNDFVEDIGYFFEKIIPFGDNGGGDYICFDYRKCNTDNPPIILWFHDANPTDARVAFVADNFEEFVNMLYEDSNLDDESKIARRKTRDENRKKKEKLRQKYIEENNTKMRQLSAQYKQYEK